MNIHRYLLILIILTAFGLRAINYKDLSLMLDEFYFTKYAYSILLNEWQWPKEYMYIQPPLFPYLLAVITRFYEGGWNYLKILTIVMGTATVYAVYALGVELYNKKVGLLASALLALSSYHIMFSKTLMLEVPVISFIFFSLYFFWRYYTTKSRFHACLAGLFLGLASITKYVGLLLFPIYILFVLLAGKRSWLRLDWKSLIRTRFLLVIFTAGIVMLPVFFALYFAGIDPFYFNINTRFSFIDPFHRQFSIFDLAIRGLNNYFDLLTDANSPAYKTLLWYPIFYLSSKVMLLGALFYFTIEFLKGKKNSTFIFIFFVVFNLFVAAFQNRFQYYLLWATPALFIMISAMAYDFYTHKSQSRFKGVLRIGFLVFFGIFFVSYFFTGINAPLLNKGVVTGYETQFLKVKDRMGPGDAVAIEYPLILTYYLNKYETPVQEEEINVVPLYIQILKGDKIKLVLDKEMLDLVRPKYVITTKFYFDGYLSMDEKIKFKQDYYLVSQESQILLFQRKYQIEKEDDNTEQDN